MRYTEDNKLDATGGIGITNIAKNLNESVFDLTNLVHF